MPKLRMTVTLEEAQRTLPQLIAGLKPGEEIVITQNSKPVAQMRSASESPPQPQFGSCRGKLTILAKDDGHLRTLET
jgi:antitoxin (DNA-binding transcriptional repressor) of toxin-antitoxin stability system